MGQKGRVTYLDMAKGIGILLMIAGHLFAALQGIDNKTYFSPVFHVISSFHMPLFFIISGILIRFAAEEEKDWGVTLKRKIKSLMIPYLSFSITYLTINGWVYFVEPKKMERGFMPEILIYAVTFRGISVLWFLPTLFFGEILFVYVKKRLALPQTILLFSATGIAMLLLSGVFRFALWEENYVWMTVGAVLLMTARSLLSCTFLLAGYLFGCVLEKRQDRTVLGFLLGAAVFCSFCALSFFNVDVDLNYMVFGNIVIYMLCACGMSAGVILMCKNICQSRLLIFYGVNSLVIMATHMQYGLMVYSIQFAYWVNTFVTRAKEYVFFFTIYGALTVFELFWIYMYRYHLYFLVGKRKPEKTGEEKRKDGIKR